MHLVPYLKIWHLALNFLWSKHHTILLTAIYQYHSLCLYLVWHTNAKKKNWNFAVEFAWILFITICLYFFLPFDKNNRLFPYSNNIHFRNKAKCKSSLVKRSLIYMRIKKHSHINSFANSLTLKHRFGATRKWLIY